LAIVVGVNLMVYAYEHTAPQHSAAVIWLEAVFSEAALVYLPWQSIAGFFCVMTHRRLPGIRFTEEEAAQIIASRLRLPNVRAVGPGAGHRFHSRRMLVERQATGAVGGDAALAALTIEMGGVFHTADREFARFPGLRWKNPLV
jgi:toxin-antitoxin system PIN domain toxin